MDRGGCQFGEKNKKKADDVHLRPTGSAILPILMKHINAEVQFYQRKLSVILGFVLQ